MEDWCTPEAVAMYFIEIMKLQNSGMLPKPLNSRPLDAVETSLLTQVAAKVRKQSEDSTVEEVHES